LRLLGTDVLQRAQRVVLLDRHRLERLGAVQETAGRRRGEQRAHRPEPPGAVRLLGDLVERRLARAELGFGRRELGRQFPLALLGLGERIPGLDEAPGRGRQLVVQCLGAALVADAGAARGGERTRTRGGRHRHGDGQSGCGDHQREDRG
jgi:hypothetical protein